jgi:Holliday junction resolvase RusA-like endonuclease
MKPFFIAGIPVAKGSMKAFINRKNGRPILTHTNAPEQKAWASSVAYAAQKEGAKLTKDAIFLGLEFHMPRPKGHFNKSGLSKSAPMFHVKKPDLDKLTRMIMDSLTGIVWEDDSQVVSVKAEKVYAKDSTGVLITIND